MPNESGASWFSPKCVEAQPPMKKLGVKHCFGAGRPSRYQIEANSEYQSFQAWDESGAGG